MTRTLEKIMLIEDEEDIQSIVSMALDTLGGFKVEVCSSGAEALQKAPECDPDLILLDIRMPKMDGPATLKALRQIDAIRDTPVIFMTANTQPHEVAGYRAMGVVDVITKPFDPVKLPGIISDIWNSHYEKVSGNFDSEMASIRAIYLQGVPDKLSNMELLIHKIESNPNDHVAAEELLAMAHKLHGSAGSYGFSKASVIAAEMEQELKSLVNGQTRAEGSPSLRIRQNLMDMREEFKVGG